MNIAVRPGPLRGRVEIPASKSVAHRAMIAAALADRPTQIVLNAVGVGIIFLLVLGTVLLVLFGGR